MRRINTLPGTRIVGVLQVVSTQLYEPMHLQSSVINSSLPASSGGIETIPRGLPESPSFLFLSTSKDLFVLLGSVAEAAMLSDQRG